MKIATLRMVVPTAGLLALLTTTSAFAQDATADQPPPPTVQTQTQVGMGLPGATPQATAAVPVGGTDHSLVAGHLGFGYLGRPGVPVGVAGAVVDAPVIGVRYWFDQSMGLDLGLGLGISGGSADGGDPPSLWAFVLHGGVPLALASGRHYTFEIIPEANIGLGGGTTTAGTLETSHKGFMLDLGARAGAEIQFGFIGIPELALQGSIGAMFSLANQSSEPDGGENVSASQTRFNTTVYNSPWAIFTNSVSALYYF
jgi:hypothetical protein